MGVSYMNCIVHISYIVQLCSVVNAEMLLAVGTTMVSDNPLLKIGPKSRKQGEDF